MRGSERIWEKLLRVKRKQKGCIYILILKYKLLTKTMNYFPDTD